MRRYSNFVPPHGTNIRSEQRLALDVVSRALTGTVRFLRDIGPPEGRLIRYDDWWEHDGLHFNRPDGDIDFAALARMVETPDALRAAMDGNNDVYAGVAPMDFKWYLRFYHRQDGYYQPPEVPWVGAGPFGCFDVTLPDALVEAYRRQVLVPLGIEAQEQEAIEYFISIGMDSYSPDGRKMRPDKADY